MGTLASGTSATLTGQELGDLGRDRDGRLTEDEQLVDHSADTAENDSDEPRSEREARHVRVIGDLDNGSDLGIWRVFGDEQCLKPHLVNDLLVLVWALEDGVLVVEELIDALEDRLGEVLVVLVQLEDLFHNLRVS